MSYRVWLQTVTWPASAAADVEANASLACEILSRTPRDRPSIACFPEGFLDWGVSGPPLELAEAIDACWPAIREAVRGIDGFVLLPSIRQGVFGWQVVTHCLDGDGTIVATYAKRNPWPRTRDLDHFEYDAVPGGDSPLLRIGSIKFGIQMCFDVNWAAGWERLAEGGARLILFPSAYPGGFPLQARAWQSGAVVAAAVRGGGPSPIVDLTGSILKLRRVPDNLRPFPLNLNRVCVHRDHQAERLEALRRAEPHLSMTRLPMDNMMLVVGGDDGPDVGELLENFGIETRDHYLARARLALQSRAPA